jgi:TPP-dependent pyruvate/acetoin dehydrogenase alpha subunit
VKLLAQWLAESRLADEKLLSQIETEVSKEIKDAAQSALNAPYPPVEEVNQHVYA